MGSGWTRKHQSKTITIATASNCCAVQLGFYRHFIYRTKEWIAKHLEQQQRRLQITLLKKKKE